MKFVREDYQEKQNKRNVIMVIIAAVVVVGLIVLMVFNGSSDTGKKKIAKTQTKESSVPTKPADQKEQTSTQQQPEKPKDLPALISQARKSVVLIKTFDSQGKVLGQGTGFFVDTNGHVISNRHVFKDAYRAEVEAKNGTFRIKKVLAHSIDYDLVRVQAKIGQKTILPLPLADTTPRPGEKVVVIGNPLGLEATVSDGIVSSVRELEPFGTVIQITSPISPGSSGSPVMNMKGEVVGVATMQILEGQNLNFAIPITRLKEMETIDKEDLADINFEAGGIFRAADNPFDKGMILFNEKQYEGAISFFKQVVKENPNNFEAYYHLGICYRETHITKAVEAFKSAIALDPQYAEAYCQMGITYSRMNMNKEAIEALKEATKLKVGYDEAMKHLGIAYYMDKKYNLATRWLNNSLDIFPNADAFYYLGVSYYQSKQYDKAINALSQSIEMDEKKIEAYIALGASYADIQYWTRGIRILNKAVIIDPSNNDVHFTLGMLHLGNRDLVSAQHELSILRENNAGTKYVRNLSEAIEQYKLSR